MVEDAQHDQNQVADHECGGQKVDDLERFGIFFLQDDTRLAAVFHLTEKRAELDTAFVIDKSIREETATVTICEDSGTQVNILAIAQRSEAFQGFVNRFLDSQIEAARIEFVQFLLAARMPPVVKNEVIA